MSDTGDPHSRIDALEIRIAYQDQALDDLNQTVLAQWKQIDSLTRQIANLIDRVKEAEEKVGAPPRTEPPPPHY